MPKQIYDSKTFKSLIPRAEEIRVVRSKGKTKLKIRTKSMLYTYVSDDAEAEKLLRNVDKPIVEVNPKKEKPEKERKTKKQEPEQEEEKPAKKQVKKASEEESGEEDKEGDSE